VSGDESRRKRVRAAHRLSAIKVSKVKKPGLYEDGAGLRLVVTDKGTKRWALRLTINGRRVERGLGVYPDVGLDHAREKAAEMRRAAKDGRDARAVSCCRFGGHQPKLIALVARTASNSIRQGFACS
jgi:Arm domain-containing DNA-binding protein